MLRRMTGFAIAALSAATAHAHIVAQPNSGAAGATVASEFVVTHGCGASATIAVRLQVPPDILSIKPQAKPGWSITLEKRPVDPPQKGLHGETIADAVSAITWRGGPLPNDWFDTFVVRVQLPKGAARTLYFPTVQTCETGEVAWTEIPAAGHPWGSVAHPAPFIRVLATMADAAGSDEKRVGDLVITQAWSRATPSGAKVGAGYLTVTNTGRTPDRLTNVATAAAGRAEVHEMAVTDGVMTMRPLAVGLALAPGQTVKLAPGGVHLMFTDLKAAFREGDIVPVTMTFERAGTIDIALPVAAIGAPGPGAPAANAGTHEHH